MDNDTTDPLLSRTGVDSPIGSLTEPVATKVDMETHEAFARICREAGSCPASALRNYICKVVHGKTFDDLVREAAQRKRLSLGLEDADGVLLVNGS